MEISYKNESPQGLREKLYRWMGSDTTVQVAIGINIGRTVSRFVLMRRNPAFDGVENNRLIGQTVDFEAGQQHHVAFPVSDPFSGGVLPLALVSHENDEIVLDLPELLELIDARTQ